MHVRGLQCFGSDDPRRPVKWLIPGAYKVGGRRVEEPTGSPRDSSLGINKAPGKCYFCREAQTVSANIGPTGPMRQRVAGNWPAYRIQGARRHESAIRPSLLFVLNAAGRLPICLVSTAGLNAAAGTTSRSGPAKLAGRKFEKASKMNKLILAATVAFAGMTGVALAESPQPLDAGANIQSAQVEAPYQATTGLDYAGTASIAAPMVDRSAPGSTVADLNSNYNYSGR